MQGKSVSICAPCAESNDRQQLLRRSPRISIHAPRVGSDKQESSGGKIRTNFNPRSPCGERHRYNVDICANNEISIHAPRVGSDRNSSRSRAPESWNFNPRSPCGERLIERFFWLYRPSEFQSTLPVWGATLILIFIPVLVSISIHAPRVGSDPCVDICFKHFAKYFNPRSPCGERRTSRMRSPS